MTSQALEACENAKKLYYDDENGLACYKRGIGDMLARGICNDTLLGPKQASQDQTLAFPTTPYHTDPALMGTPEHPH
jgi:hypothetical protein